MASGPAVHTGGCQCGAVRFRATGTLDDVSICHCRMCQKAFGAYYAPLVTVPDGHLEWIRGAPRHFQSSNLVRRGFCEACGTPLTYESPNGVSVAAGAFDDPSTLVPVIQYGIEGRLPYVDGLSALPARTTVDSESSEFLARIVSFQHPDHDTPDAPPPA
ncbi:GFA family protein [Pseudoxanthomonas sp. 10H]|uniref:GFA family protein n=1 Tax=Pseudoxanthomonas sp. 10H TaxID=3242729 RepID=UPI003556CDB6